MKQIRVSRSCATRVLSFIAWKYRSATVRSESVPWNATSIGSSSGRIGRSSSAEPSRAVHDETRCVGYGRIAGRGQLRLLHLRPVDDDACVQRQQAIGRGQQRVDVDLLDPTLLDDEVAEPDQELLELPPGRPDVGRAHP